MFSKDKSCVLRVIAIVMTVAMIAVCMTGCFAPATSGDGTGTGAEGGENAGMGGMGIMTLVLYMGIIIAVFYFLMIRPEKKRKKKAQEMRDSLAIGDNITTIGGMVGKIVNISDEFVTFETGEDRVRIKITKWGISSTGKDTQETEDKVDNRGTDTESK